MFALLRKELKTYFLTPAGWIFLAVFLLISGLLFSLQLVFPQNSQYSGFLGGLIFLFLLVVPLLTMRIFTDEKRFQTDQLLLTSPVNLWGIVLGKYIAALCVFLITVAVTFIYPLLLSFHGKLDWSMIIGTYFGFLLVGASFIAIGVFVSQAAEGAVGAAILTFCALTVTFIVDFLQPYMPSSETAGLVWVAILMALALFRLFSTGRNPFLTALIFIIFAVVLLVLWFVDKGLFSGLIGRSLVWVSLTRRFGSFAMGILRLDSVVYYLSFSGFFLFLTVQGLEKRRWS
ncbi:MAG: ABC transporter permease [Spirochaetales bacterium]|nr:MAG: ABC transporter permease [Spirochaetales bacterium]